MNEKQILRVQGVLYQNDIASLQRALDSLCHAISKEIISEQGRLSKACIAWGDASPAPCFTSEAIAALQRALPENILLEYTYFGENTGYGKGHNRLAKQDPNGSDLLLILNPDILVMGNFFFEMLSPLSDPTVGLTEARQTPFEHPKQYDPKTKETFWSSGACFVIPKALFDQLGGFDEESFFMYCEDVDLSLRIRQMGRKLIYCPNAPAYHAKRADENGVPACTATELRHSPEALLVLAHKWGKHREEKHLLSQMKEGTDAQKEAAASFERRLEEGSLKKMQGKTDFFSWADLENRF